MLDKAVVDISHWDEVVSFAEARADGVVGIIHKITEGADYVDPNYDKNKKAARAAGLLWGAYHFLRPGDMHQQATFFISKIGENIGLYAADHEDAGVSLADLKKFLATVKTITGKTPVLYSGSVLKEQIGSARDVELAQYPLWLAQYTSGEPSWPTATWPHWWLWQYTESGDCDGIPGDSDGNVDVNRYAGTEAQLRADWIGKQPKLTA